MAGNLSPVLMFSRKTDVNLLEEIDGLITCHVNFLLLIHSISESLSQEFFNNIDALYQSERYEIKGKLKNSKTIDTDRLSLRKIGFQLRPRRLKNTDLAEVFDFKFTRPEFIYRDDDFKCILREADEIELDYSINNFSNGMFIQVDSDYLKVISKFIEPVNTLRNMFVFLNGSVSSIITLRKKVYPKVKLLSFNQSYSETFIGNINEDVSAEYNEQLFAISEYYRQIQLLINQLLNKYKSKYSVECDIVKSKLSSDIDYSGLICCPAKILFSKTKNKRKKNYISRIYIRRYIAKVNGNTIYKPIKTRFNNSHNCQVYNMAHTFYHSNRPVPEPYIDLVTDLINDCNFFNMFIKKMNHNVELMDSAYKKGCYFMKPFIGNS